MLHTTDVINQLTDQLRRTFDGAAWHGPNLLDSLRDLPAEQRLVRIGDSHNIAELVRHLIAWRRYAIRKLTGDRDYEVTDPENFATLDQLDEPAWERMLEELQYTQHRLVTLLEHSDDTTLLRRVPGRDFSFSVLLHGIVHHDVYHQGQIALLRKKDA